MATNTIVDKSQVEAGVPWPIVQMNRWVFALGLTAAAVLQAPLVTTALLWVDLLPLLFGRRWSLTAAIGRMLWGERLQTAETEHPHLINFNRTLVVVMLVGAQAAFVFGLPLVGWALSLAVAAVNGIALAGFCLGCFLYYQFRLNRYRLSR